MKNNGFTLVELVVVMAIIGLLSGIILPVFLHGGLEEGLYTFQSSVLSAKTYAITKRKKCTLTLSADYYTGANPLPCTLTVEEVGTTTFKKQYRLPKYIRIWEYGAGSAAVGFTSGTKTVCFDPSGIAHDNDLGTHVPQDVIVTLKDIKTGTSTSRTIIGNTCQIKK